MKVKAVRVHEYGGPEKLVYEDIEIGTPGPGQALRVRRTAAKQATDASHQLALPPPQMQLPYEPPHLWIRKSVVVPHPPKFVNF